MEKKDARTTYVILALLLLNSKIVPFFFWEFLLLILNRYIYAGLEEYVTSSLHTRSIPLQSEEMNDSLIKN